MLPSDQYDSKKIASFCKPEQYQDCKSNIVFDPDMGAYHAQDSYYGYLVPPPEKKFYFPSAQNDLQLLDKITFYSFHDERYLSVSEHLQQSYCNSILAVKNNEIFIENYFNNEGAAHKPHMTQSVSKPLSALVCLSLIEDGILNYTDRVSEHIEMPYNSPFYNATLFQLLNMSVSLDLVENYDTEELFTWMPGILSYLYDNGELTPHPLTANSRARDTMIEKAAWEHGTNYVYSSANIQLLSMIVERVTGASFAQNFYERIWAKSGAENEAFLITDRRGFCASDGGFCIAPRDLAKIAMALVHDGWSPAGYKIVDQSTISDIRDLEQAQDMKAFENHYNRGFMVYAGDNIFHTGIYGQICCINVPTQTAVIINSIQPYEFDHRLQDNNVLAAHALCMYLAGTPDEG